MTIKDKQAAVLLKLEKYALPVGDETIESRAESIPYDLIINPNISVGIYLQEAFNLNFYAQPDKENLSSKGLDWRLVEELPRRIDFVREREARWYSTRYSETASQKELERIFKLIDKSRKEVLATMEFAFFGDSLARAVKYIEKGDGAADYAQDLSDIVTLAEEHMSQLIAVGCETHHIDVLKENRFAYSDLVAECDVDEELKPSVRVDRDRAYTFLVVAVETIRRAAHHAFWNDKKRLRGYACEYFRKSTRKGNGDK